MQHTHKTLTVTVTLKSGQVITKELYQVDTEEQWLVLVGHQGDIATNTIAFEDCASVMDQAGNDLLKRWTEKQA